MAVFSGFVWGITWVMKGCVSNKCLPGPGGEKTAIRAELIPTMTFDPRAVSWAITQRGEPGNKTGDMCPDVSCGSCIEKMRLVSAEPMKISFPTTATQVIFSPSYGRDFVRKSHAPGMMIRASFPPSLIATMWLAAAL